MADIDLVVGEVAGRRRTDRNCQVADMMFAGTFAAAEDSRRAVQVLKGMQSGKPKGLVIEGRMSRRDRPS